MKANALLVAVVSLTFVLSTACERQPEPPTAAETHAGLAALGARPDSPRFAGGAHIRAAGNTLVPDVPGASGAVTARVVLPGRANGQIHVEDAATGTGIDIALVGAKSTAGQVADGYVVYPKGYASGSIYERAEPSGVEDFVAFDERPASPSIAYNVALGAKVAGLRLVENQLEMLDSAGVPRLRVAPPYVVGADDAVTDPLVAVEGCAVDTSPAGPWGRKVTPPGAKSCRVRISWSNDSVQYPALVDPRWQTTGSMSVARQDHNLVYLPLTGRVLAVGGRSSPTGTTGLASAELFDKASGTWSATSSMSAGRWSASATLLGSSSNGTTSQKVLIAGGINGTTSLTTAQLYNQTAGTWAAAGTLNAARHSHTATLLADGRVLVCGGMNGSTVLTSAALYNPASGSGSWAATTGPIPPPGWRSGTATLIQTSNGQLNNKVLLAGGNNGSNTISAVYLFDPAQSAFSTLASMPSPREGHQAVALSDGRILLSGGKNGSTYLASTVIFDPPWGPGSWTASGNMTSPRWGHAMTLIPSGVLHLGLVLVSGGSNGTSTLSSTEYWNGTNWATDGAMVAPVQQHGSVVLGNSILVAGGAINNGSTTVSAAEVYDPSIALGCTSNSQCASGFCVSGVCCNSACNGGCGSCNLAGHVGVCTPLTSGTVCRAMTGMCDAAETCDGSSLACPANAFLPSATVCRPSADVCDVAEACNGSSAACPADTLQPSTTLCRPSTGACDIPESCTGTSAACPPDQLQPATTVCRASAGICDIAENCTGASAACPPDALQPPATVCRAPAGVCDVAESCNGTSPDCPPDSFLQASLECRSAVGPCDVAEVCSGMSGECPSDGLLPASAVCRPAAGDCDLVEACSGVGPDCPADAFATPGTLCRASTGACDPAESCSGASPTCPTDVTIGPPAVPSDLTAVGGDAQVSLAWTASSGAASYQVKRGTSSGGPYGTVFPATGPSLTDTSVTVGTYYYYVVTAVNDCGASASSAGVSATPFVAIPPRALPKAPAQEGCYWYTADGWETIPCEPVSDAIAAIGTPVIPPSLATRYAEATPNPPESPKPVFIPAPGVPHTPLVFAQADIMFPVVESVTDVYLDPVPFPKCPVGGSPTANAYSVQLNTNKFLMDNGHNGAVQFSIGSSGLGSTTHICAWQVDATDQKYDSTTVCVPTPPRTRSTKLQPFDFISIAGSADAVAGTLSIVVQLSWIEPGKPNIYSQTGPDRYGLGGRWLTADGAMLGLGYCSQAQFENTSAVTRLMVSSCPGVTSANSNTTGCPTPALQPNVTFENKTATAESNNLIQVGTPSVSYLNPYLAVTNTTATTSGACLDPKHIYVRDYDSDSGAVPSNAAGQAFWESPDIFLVPRDAHVNPNSNPDQSLITPGGHFDVWVRVNNDLGCAAVKGAKALVYIADPSALSTAWKPLTGDEYRASTSEGTIVSAGVRALIGPFQYDAPTTGFGDSHKCLIAAVIAENEPAVANYFDAPGSNQVAQRNVEFENCAFPLTNAAGVDGNLDIVLTAVPPETKPSLGPSGPNLSVEFEDGDSSWHDIWVAQPENGKAYSVSKRDGKTTVRLGKASVPLHQVVLHDGDSRAARASIVGLPSGAPLTTLSLQATLKSLTTGELLAPANGGSCKVLGGIVIP